MTLRRLDQCPQAYVESYVRSFEFGWGISDSHLAAGSVGGDTVCAVDYAGAGQRGAGAEGTVGFGTLEGILGGDQHC